MRDDIPLNFQSKNQCLIFKNSKMKYFFFPLLLLYIKGFAQDTNPNILKILHQQEQALVDAIALGDKTVWQKYLHDSCLITIEDGSFLTKKKLLEDLNPLPPAYKGRIEVIEPILKQYGNTAVFTFINDEYLELYGQKIHTQYRQTDTWALEKDEWKVIAMQLFEIPKNPPPLSISEKILRKYMGNYELSPDKHCKITLEKGKLYAHKTGKEPVELFAETENVFFRKGDGRIRVIFLKDKKGNAYKMIERRAGEDVVYYRFERN
jgi:hypothetical protein